MGLTVHHTFQFHGSEKEAKDKLQSIRKRVSQLPVESVGPLVKLDWKNGTDDPDANIRWMKIQYIRSEQLDDHSWRDVYPEVGYGFTVLVGEGCEPMNIALTRMKGQAHEWEGSSFCKDQYASEFLKCHLLITAILDICKETGILKSVDDEGGFWEGRDLKVLSEAISGSTAMLKEFAEVLRKALPEGVELRAGVDSCENYVIVDQDRRQGRR